MDEKVLISGKRTRVTGVKTERVKILRERLGISQEKFAKEIGVSTDIISKVEQGAKGLTLNVALKICRRYGLEHDIDMDWLVKSDMVSSGFMESILALQSALSISESSQGQARLTLSIDEHLLEFLLGVGRADRAKKELELSDKLYKDMLIEIKQRYSQACNKAEKGEPIVYRLVDAKEI